MPLGAMQRGERSGSLPPEEIAHPGPIWAVVFCTGASQNMADLGYGGSDGCTEEVHRFPGTPALVSGRPATGCFLVALHHDKHARTKEKMPLLNPQWLSRVRWLQPLIWGMVSASGGRG